MVTIQKFEKEKLDHLEGAIDFYVKHLTWLNPDDPSPSEESLRNRLTTESSIENIERWLVWQDDVVVAYGGFAHQTEASDEFEVSGMIGDLFITVLKDYRGKGYSKLIVEKICQEIQDHHLERFQYFAQNKTSINWSDRIGAKKGPFGGENRLKFTDLDRDVVELWINQGQENNSETKFHHFVSTIPDSIAEQFCNLYTETMNQAPSEGVDYETRLTVTGLKERERIAQEQEQVYHIMVTEEANGELSGMTETIYLKNNPYLLHQELTGVREKFRGRGLGKWLKATMIDYIQKNHPEVTIISTGNADSNKPMMSINERLGFKPHHRNIIYEIEKAQLCSLV